MLSVNETALDIVEEMIDLSEEFKIKAHTLDNGATVIDCGVEVAGSYEAGLAFTDACMGGLGTATLCMRSIGNVLGSGPARALAQKPAALFKRIAYHDDADCAVIVLESNRLPDDEVMQFIADGCGVDVGDVFALVAPTACIVGSVQVSGRVIETAIRER